MVIMVSMWVFSLILVGFPLIKAIKETYNFFVLKSDTSYTGSFRLCELICIVINPGIFILMFDAAQDNDCCSDSAFFSPAHRLTIYFLLLLCIAAYFYSSYRIKLAPPLIELFVNAVLILALPLNVIIAIQSREMVWLCLVGNTPVILLFLIMISKNHQLLQTQYTLERKPGNFIEYFCMKILGFKGIFKYPLLLIICLPVLLIVSALLYVFGQRPDSIVRAFTDTYKHGFSQLDYMCDNVNCGGHYLCSVAANGHKKIVKPQRFGERNGHRIICNRQLLISNAFEELLEDHFPKMHKPVRRAYNKVGDLVHRYYGLFNIRWIADVIYFFMKPLEWIFLITLYIFDRKPENRINRQYMSREDRRKINQYENEEVNFF